MKKAAILLICSLTILLLVGVWLVQSLLVIQRIAAVSDARGTVTVRSHDGGRFQPLADKRHVLAGDVLQTGHDGRVTLNWVDGSRIRVGPDTTMHVLKCQLNSARQSESYLFSLDVGRVWVRVLKALSRQSKFEIHTPTATAAVRGTVFSVAVAKSGQTSVSVLKGQVDVRSGERKLEVGELQEAAVGAGAPGAVVALSATEAANWETAMDVAQPAVALVEPTSDKLAPDAQTVTVAGVAERGAHVAVNGQPVEVKLTGKFETRVAVPAGAKELPITVSAIDRKGFEHVIGKRLVR